MSFDTWQFAIFLPCVLAGYFALPKRGQNLWLLAASYAFYASWDVRFLGLVMGSTLLDYWVSSKLARTEAPRQRKLLLATSIGANLGVLATFKYFDWFMESMEIVLSQFDVQFLGPSLNIVLPVGISFYTLQTLAYTIDVYKRRQAPCPSLIDFALFVAFFPQLVAGPIERASALLPQLQRKRRVNYEDFGKGAWLILVGLFKKVALADAMAPIVNEAFANPGESSAAVLWRGAYLFAFQLYFDFGGYSDIARGSAKLLGIDLMENFHQPFFAHSPVDLWRRWHISLSTWFRDYLYIPLGGSRGRATKVALIVLLTMTISGLWHGASGTMLAWGFLNGSFLALQRISGFPSRQTSALGKGVGIFVTFHIFVVTCIFFRAPDFPSALEYFSGILSFGGSEISTLYLAFYYAVLLLFLDVPCERAGHHLAALKWPAPVRGLVMGVMIIFIVAWSRGQDVPFIYYQF